MDLYYLLDPVSAIIVAGGTVAATALRVGFADFLRAVRVMRHLAGRGFNERDLKADLARMIKEVEADGLIRAQVLHFRDGEMQRSVSAMIAARSYAQFQATADLQSDERLSDVRAAYQTLTLAAENAPSFGLAGTLLSLSQISSASGQSMNAVLAGAVLTTLYGVLFGQIILVPLAEAVRRAGEREDMARKELMEWAGEQLKKTHPKSRAWTDAA